MEDEVSKACEIVLEHINSLGEEERAEFVHDWFGAHKESYI